MKTIAITISTVLFAVTAYNKLFNNQTEGEKLIKMFELWVETHNKFYPTPQERIYRMKAFEKNLKQIQKVNSRNLNYRLGLNKFSDLTKDEFESKYLGYLPPISSKEPLALTQESQPPKEVNWVTAGAVSEVKNQEECGSCWAFSAVGAIEGAQQIKTKTLLTYSEQQLIDCSGPYGNSGCQGGYMKDAFRYVINNGLTSEEKYSYKGVDGSCKYNKDMPHVSLSTFTAVKESEGALMVAVAHQPVSVAIYAPPIMQYAGGIYDDLNACPSSPWLLDHGVLAVGYGSQDGQDYWLVKNSWGADWGEEGYIRFVRKSTGTGICGIALLASFPSI